MGPRRVVAPAREPDLTSRYGRVARAARRPLLAVALMILSALVLSACGGGSNSSSTVTQKGLYGKLPPAGQPTHGGTITYGLVSGSTTPNYIFPIVPSGNASTSNYAWQQAMYLPLYNNFAFGSSPGIQYKLSVANKPTFSDGNKTVTIQLKHGYKWNDGHPVDAQDVAVKDDQAGLRTVVVPRPRLLLQPARCCEKGFSASLH